MSFQYVKIHYGPCESFHSFIHRPQKVHGLRLSLQKLGYRVDLNPVELIDFCGIEMCGYEIFQCNIKSLKFNMGELRDPVCQRAVDAVTQAACKMQRARNYLWSLKLIESQIIQRHMYAPKDFWQLDMDTKALGNTCADCCQILLVNVPDDKAPNKDMAK